MHGDGTGRNHEKWLPVVSLFAEMGYCFYSLSMPGYGKSTGKQDYFRFYGEEVLNLITQNLNIKSAVILGRSVGGKTAIKFTNRYPEKVSALIL